MLDWHRLIFLFSIFLCSFVSTAFAQKINRLKSVEEILEIRKKAIFKISKFENGKRLSLGTGFFVNRSGLAITNFHVLYKSGDLLNSSNQHKQNIDMNMLLSSSTFQYEFSRFDKSSLPSPKVLGCGNKNNLDICYLQFDLKKTPYIPLEEVRVGTGHNTFSIGYCGGELNIKKGKIKNYHKDFLNYYSIHNINFNLNTKMIEITNPICPGDSGGPIFNRNGNLVGITTIRFSRSVKNEQMKDDTKLWLLGITVDEVKKVKKEKSISLLNYKGSTKKVRRPADPFYIP